MLRLLTLPVITLAAAASAQDKAPVIFTNEEQVYFDKEAGRPVPHWTGVMVTPARGKADLVPYTISFIDAFGTPVASPMPLAALARQISQSIDRDRLELTINGGRIELRKARPVSCWVAIRKNTLKTDGSEDWHFVRGVQLHDQGGRALVGAALADADPVLLRVRNVTWDRSSTNHPVVTLYVHKPDKPDRAESYSWAAPESSRIGINLRWMQAGCTVGDSTPASALTKDSFRQ